MSESQQKNGFIIHRIEDDILFFSFTGDLSKEIASDFSEYIHDLLEKEYSVERPLRLISNSAYEGHSSPGARRHISKLLTDKRIGRIAIYNGSAILRVIMSFILRAIRRDNVRFFDTEVDSINWIKEQ